MDKSLKATFETVTPFKSFDVFVTAEQDAEQRSKRAGSPEGDYSTVGDAAYEA